MSVLDIAAKLITSIAAFLSAIAWPAVFTAFILLFRPEIRSAISRLPGFLDRVRNVKVPGFEAKLDALADRAPEKGEVTAEQTKTAAQIAADAIEFGVNDIFRELDKLCLLYDSLRRTLPSGHIRTQEMTRIIVKMRALGPAASAKLEAYKISGSAGSRLAAIAIMQMKPDIADISWLLDRFRIEAPFLFYHAALALTNLANIASETQKGKVFNAARTALEIIKSFNGLSDSDTIMVLESLVNS